MSTHDPSSGHGATAHDHGAHDHDALAHDDYAHDDQGHDRGARRGRGSGGGHGQAARGHGHGHGHVQVMSPDTDRKWLTGALVLIVVFMAGEVVIGVVAQSLALISDAAHMLTDAMSIVLALIAMRLAARPPKGGYTYGLKRAEILSAQANGITLLLLAGWLAYEAVRRFIEPPEVGGALVLVTALAGVAVNLAATWMLSRADRSSLNIEGAFQHILNDLFAFIATAVAGLVMVTTGFARADAIATLVVVALMVKAGVGLVRESGRILLEAAPAGLEPEKVGPILAASPHVSEVHDLHIWQITSGMPAASAHVLVTPGRDCHTVRADLEALLHDLGITHTTLQVDHSPSQYLMIGRPHAAEYAQGDVHGPTHYPPHPS